MPYYRFIVKEAYPTDSEGKKKVAKILFKSNWIHGESITDAIGRRDEYLNSHPEYQNYLIKWEVKEIIGRGGARKGAGTKSPGKNGAYKGMNSKWGESTTVMRIPVSKSGKIDSILTAIETIEGVINAWEGEIKNATQTSVTSKTPRTYDKAKQLLAELKEELDFSRF